MRTRSRLAACPEISAGAGTVGQIDGIDQVCALQLREKEHVAKACHRTRCRTLPCGVLT